MNRETLTLYKKVGRRYVKHDDYLDERGLPCGLYLFYKPNYKEEHSAMKNIMYYAKVHDVKNVGKFSELIAGHEDEVIDVIMKTMEHPFSANEMALNIFAKLSEL